MCYLHEFQASKIYFCSGTSKKYVLNKGVYKSGMPGHRGCQIWYGGASYLWALGM
jgi:hypothetical protein